jgi:hypothetical protein
MSAQEKPRSESERIATDRNTPAPRPRRWRRAVLALGRIATWWVLAPPRAGMRLWSRLNPVQQFVVGFGLYARPTAPTTTPGSGPSRSRQERAGRGGALRRRHARRSRAGAPVGRAWRRWAADASFLLS